MIKHSIKFTTPVAEAVRNYGQLFMLWANKLETV